MSVETYEAMLDQNELDTAIAAAEAEYRSSGTLLDAHEVLSSLRRKHFNSNIKYQS